MADYLSPPPSLSSFPPLSPPFFFLLPAFVFSSFFSLQNWQNFFCVSLSGEWKQVQSASHLRGKKSEKLALPLPLFALQTQKDYCCSVSNVILV